VIRLAEPLKKNSYGQYLLELVEDEEPHLNEPYLNTDRRAFPTKGIAL
jgi:hypothetical protein